LGRHWEAPFNDQRMQLLEEVTRALSAPGDVASTMRLGARCVVPGLAQAVLMVVRKGIEDRLEVVHTDPQQETGIAARLWPLLPALRNAAARERQKGREFRWIPVVNEASTRFLQGTPELARLLRDFDVRSLMVVPLRSGGQLFGAMAFARNEDATPFYAADLAVAQVIARRVAVAIESAQLHERSLDQESQRSRLEDALQKWIQVFDLAGWGAAVVDGTDRRIEAVNPAFARLHGYSDADSLTGRLFAELLPLDRAAELDDWFASVANRSGPYESLHLRADGSTFPALTNVTALELGPKETSYVVTMQDLTELKRAEERTRWAQRMEAAGRLAGGVAHEVNNMMTIIIGFGDLLSKARNLPPDRQRDVEEIRKAALRAAKITQQLLAFSRQQALQPTDLELNDVVTDIVPVLRLLLPANLKVETSLASVPPAVHADRAQLDQVLINLAFNARDAMPAGGTIRLATGSRELDAEDGPRLIGVPIPPGEYALLSVSDTGHGMDPATLAHAFEPFFTTKPAGSGTGLGLATVYGIVKQSGGFVWAESRPGAGTTFTFSLPRLDRPIPAVATAHPAERRAQPQVGGTVLVVEDEEGVRELTRRVLEQEGCRVFDAQSGQEAATTLERFGSEIDLVISDVILPDMAATELERRVGETRPDLPVLYMSAYSRDEVLERGLIPADRPFVQKPFTAVDLTGAVWREMEARYRAVVSG
jgi:two-component system, cell cycle sensor histidine kinase and response regulator CckA